MAIVTGDLYKGFTFGDVSSKDYGVYITQDAAYNAPDRDVEVVEIAGRNGAYILDKGRFKNITVSYKCGIALDDEQSFESAIRTFRNALSSKAGKYVRLEDEYNPNEYRQAAFLGGIEVDMADRRAGEFTVSFDAKPQRFLKSGETAVSVASGGTLNNPTLFESHPLLQVWGYGDIGINDDTITISDDVIGDIILVESKSFSRTNANSNTWELQLDTSSLRDGDAVKMVNFYSGFTRGLDTNVVLARITSVSGEEFEIKEVNANTGRFFIQIPELTFSVNHSESYTSVWRCNLTLVDQTTAAYRVSVTVSYSDSNKLTIQQTVSPPAQERMRSIDTGFDRITAYSTKSALGEPLYFDLDVGEAYKIEDGQTISVNNAVSFPARLPVLKPGANTITYENTVDQFKVVPRWWEV